MFRFFRKLRQSMFQNGDTSKYLKYAIGEVALVMIGILLALQVNNWNNNRTNTNKELWYLDNIANDMFYQKDGLTELKKYYKETLVVAESLLLDYQKTKNYETIDSLSFKLNQLMLSYSYPNIDNTYRELLSSGQVSLIENYDILSDVIDFYLYTAEIETMFKVNQSQVFYGEVYTTLNKYAEIDLSEYTENDDLLFSDKEVVTYILSELKKPKNKLELTYAIRNKIVIVADYLSTVDESLEEVNRMIKAIDLEIERLK